MNADEKEIYDFLKERSPEFVSVNEISKRLGVRRRYDADRTWAHPILRRMELDKIVETNAFGEYRVAGHSDFKHAVDTLDLGLGDTTIITLGDGEE